MENETLSQIQNAELRSREYTEKSHTDLSGVISKLVGSLQKEMKELQLFVKASEIDRNNIHNKLDRIFENTENTKRRINDVETAIDDLKSRDAHLEKLIETNEHQIKAWVWRNLLIVSLLGSFLWIKESRDVIVNLLKIFL